MPILPTNTGPTTPTQALVVDPSNTVDLLYLTKALFVSVGGDLTVTMANGQKVTFVAVPNMFKLPISVSRVWLTGTSADGIVALWE